MFEWIYPLMENLGIVGVTVTVLGFFIARAFQYIYDGDYKKK